jgi:hypothetical protein
VALLRKVRKQQLELEIVSDDVVQDKQVVGRAQLIRLFIFFQAVERDQSGLSYASQIFDEVWVLGQLFHRDDHIRG